MPARPAHSRRRPRAGTLRPVSTMPDATVSQPRADAAAPRAAATPDPPRRPRGLAVVRFVRALRTHGPLLRYELKAELKSKHVNTVLGELWWLLEPVLSMAIYVLLLGAILRHGQPNYAVFILSGLLPWHWFAKAMQQGAQSLVRASGLIRAVNFPRSILTLTPILTNAIHAAVAMLLLTAVMPLIYEPPTWHVVLVPLLMISQAILTLGLALFLAVFNVFVRDVEKVLDPVLRAWYFLSPALYELNRIPAEFRGWMMLNPFAAYLPAYRDVLMHHRVPDLLPLAVWTAIGLLLLQGGLAVFMRLEGRVARVL